MNQVQKMIQKEDPHRPLKDEEIVDRLSEKGTQIGIRTISKYRNILDISTWNKRREFY